MGGWAGARAVGVPAFLPSGLCSRWMWNLRCPFRLKLGKGRRLRGRPYHTYPAAQPSPAVPSLTAAHRGGTRKASHWCGSAHAAAGPSCSWRQSCTGCTGGAAGRSAAPCGPTGGQAGVSGVWIGSSQAELSGRGACPLRGLWEEPDRKHTPDYDLGLYTYKRKESRALSLGHSENPVPALRLSLPQVMYTFGQRDL